MNWILLIIAGLFEVAFAACLGKARETTGTPALWWYGGFLAALAASMLLLLKATQTLPLGTAYAVWTGIGAVGTVLLGVLVFQEPATPWRLFFLATLIGSIIGLKAVSHEKKMGEQAVEQKVLNLSSINNEIIIINIPYEYFFPHLQEAIDYLEKQDFYTRTKKVLLNFQGCKTIHGIGMGLETQGFYEKYKARNIDVYWIGNSEVYSIILLLCEGIDLPHGVIPFCSSVTDASSL